jgi:dTDP-4-dehydrorhamnose reductase
MDIKNGKAVILGSSGMLGYAVSEFYARKNYDVIKVTSTDFNILENDISKLTKYIDGAGFVINCIGIIKQVIEHIPELDVLEINSIFPRNLAKLCKVLEVPLIHISTDCVYSGKDGNYTEVSFFDAKDLYGVSKCAGETCDCMTLRTSIIGPEIKTHKSFMDWAFEQKGKKINGYINHKWNGITTLYFAGITEKIWIENLYRKGIFHIHSPNFVTKYELLKILNEIFNLNLQITPIETEVPRDMTLNSIYDLSRRFVVKDIEQQVRELKVFFNL